MLERLTEMNQKYEQSGVDNRILKADIEALRANVSKQLLYSNCATILTLAYHLWPVDNCIEFHFKINIRRLLCHHEIC